MSMLEQLPGAHQLKQYSFKYNPPFDISSLEGTTEQVRHYVNEINRLCLTRVALPVLPLTNLWSSGSGSN